MYIGKEKHKKFIRTTVIALFKWRAVSTISRYYSPWVSYHDY